MDRWRFARCSAGNGWNISPWFSPEGDEGNRDLGARPSLPEGTRSTESLLSLVKNNQVAPLFRGDPKAGFKDAYKGLEIVGLHATGYKDRLDGGIRDGQLTDVVAVQLDHNFGQWS